MSSPASFRKLRDPTSSTIPQQLHAVVGGDDAASTEELEDGISEKHGRHRRPDDRTGELPQVRRRREERRREGTKTGETKRP
jgi:hypothetical protein